MASLFVYKPYTYSHLRFDLLNWEKGYYRVDFRCRVMPHMSRCNNSVTLAFTDITGTDPFADNSSSGLFHAVEELANQLRQQHEDYCSRSNIGHDLILIDRVLHEIRIHFSDYRDRYVYLIFDVNDEPELLSDGNFMVTNEQITPYFKYHNMMFIPPDENFTGSVKVFEYFEQILRGDRRLNKFNPSVTQVPDNQFLICQYDNYHKFFTKQLGAIKRDGLKSNAKGTSLRRRNLNIGSQRRLHYVLPTTMSNHDAGDGAVMEIIDGRNLGPGSFGCFSTTTLTQRRDIALLWRTYHKWMALVMLPVNVSLIKTVDYSDRFLQDYECLLNQQRAFFHAYLAVPTVLSDGELTEFTDPPEMPAAWVDPVSDSPFMASCLKHLLSKYRYLTRKTYPHLPTVEPGDYQSGHFLWWPQIRTSDDSDIIDPPLGLRFRYVNSHHNYKNVTLDVAKPVVLGLDGLSFDNRYAQTNDPPVRPVAKSRRVLDL